MSKETAAERLAVFMDRYGFWGARHELELMLQAAAQEERERVLAELRSEKAEAFAAQGLEHLHEECDPMGVVDRAIKIAKQEGKDEDRAEVLEALEHGHTKECTGDYEKGTPCDCPGREVMAAFDEAVRCAKQELLEKWRAEDVEKWLDDLCPHIEGVFSSRYRCEECRSEALARARAQGAAKEREKIMADWRSTDPTIRIPLKAYARLPKGQFDGRVDFHTTSCGVHQSKECDCGGN